MKLMKRSEIMMFLEESRQRTAESRARFDKSYNRLKAAIETGKRLL